MKFRKIMLVTTVGMIASLAFAAKPLNAKQKLARLEKQLNEMSVEIAQLKYEVNHKNSHQHSKFSMAQKNQKIAKHNVTSSNAKSIDKPFGTAVVTGPFTGKRTHHGHEGLIINSPSINEDEKLLQRRQYERDQLVAAGLSLPTQPRLVLSGEVAGKVVNTKGYDDKYTSDLNLSEAELNFFAEIAPAVNGFISIKYDDDFSDLSPRRLSNSAIRLDQGFVVVGNLKRSPWYASIGQLNVPFGRYSSVMISSPLTSPVGKTQARALVLNYAPQHKTAPYARVFVFKGSSEYGNSSIVKQSGGDLGLQFKNHGFGGDIGASFISNIADSKGMQNNGRMTGFRGFDRSKVESIVHGVHGGNLHAVLSYKSLTLFAEYVAALKRFNAKALTFNGRGAKPKAFHVEGLYTFHLCHLCHLPTSFAISYGRSYEALGLNIPMQRYMATLALTVLKNTLVSLEFRHDKNYRKTDTATGGGMIAFTPSELGKSDNALTAEVSVFF